MEIEIKPRNKTKEIFHKLHSRFEDLFFSIIQKLPERLIPSFLIEWLSNYITKRTQQLQQEIIQQKWEQAALEKAVQEIKASRQQDIEKAP